MGWEADWRLLGPPKPIAAIAWPTASQQSEPVQPDQKMLLCLFVGLAVTGYGMWRDVGRGSTQTVIGPKFIRSERPVAFWIALLLENTIYIVLLVAVVIPSVG